MHIIKSFDPIGSTSGNIITNGVNKDEQLLLYNSSQACILLTFNDQTQDYLPPGWAKSWVKSSPINIVKYTTVFTLGLSGQPVSILYGSIYESGEHVNDVNTPIQYVYNVDIP